MPLVNLVNNQKVKKVHNFGHIFFFHCIIRHSPRLSRLERERERERSPARFLQLAGVDDTIDTNPGVFIA